MDYIYDVLLCIVVVPQVFGFTFVAKKKKEQVGDSSKHLFISTEEIKWNDMMVVSEQWHNKQTCLCEIA